LTQKERRTPKKMEDDLQKKWKTTSNKMKLKDNLIFGGKTRMKTSQKIERRHKKNTKKWKTASRKMEDDLKTNKMEDNFKQKTPTTQTFKALPGNI
jgi:hypothetical protein